MSLGVGTRIGPYEIVAPLGAGGMGEVYRARDAKLNRDVALKVLLPAVAHDPERLARFSREAQVLASLNHPNIAHIYGIEDAAIVMELIEGEDLAQRMARGPIPLGEALPIARQIADALEAAHDHGIVHRDLKPANIKLRADGTVKVLDFGLAKAVEPSAGSSATAMNSPTLSLHATEAGMILGTAAYMSPEQAAAKSVDKRSDLWAFGVVLYEMLTGRQAFKGETVSHVIAAVLKDDPDWNALPSDTPPSIDRLLRRCLEKDRKRRLADAADARLELEDVHAPAVIAEVSRLSRVLPWAAAAAAIAVAAFMLWNSPSAMPQPSARLSMVLPPNEEITTAPVITRDGRTVAFVTKAGAADTQLYLRDLNSFEARAVAGSSGAMQPFFSPDGKWVAFFAQGQLQKVEVAGGAPIRLAEAPIAYGGTWSDDNTLIYTPSLGAGLWRIPAGGGTPESLTKPDGAAKGYGHTYPASLPGGRHVLFTVWGQNQGTAVLSLESREWQLILPRKTFGSAIFEPIDSSVGRLLIVDQSAGVRVAPFDAAKPAPTSAEGSILDNVYYDVENEARAWLAVSHTGTAVYSPADPAKFSLVWVDRDGQHSALGQDQDVYREAALSPDGTKAVVRQRSDLWIHDLQRGTRSRFTSGSETAGTTPAGTTTSSMLALWNRDGTKILFSSNRGGDWDIYAQAADGSTPAVPLLPRPFDQFPESVLADGTLLFRELHPKTGRDLLTLSRDGTVTPLRVTPANETEGQFSPAAAGGQVSLAYSSDESGRYEIYVQAYPGGANRMPVSTGGGSLPRWSRDGKELFYITGDAVMAVARRPDGTFGAPQRLFDRANYFLRIYSSYDVSPDGKRFLMIRRDAGSVPRQLNVMLNWGAELKK